MNDTGTKGKITRIVVGAYGENAWIAPCGSGLAAVVDPGDEAQRILDATEKMGLRLAAALFTHGHLDHIAAIPGLLAANPAMPLHMAAADAEWCFSMQNALPPYTPVLDVPKTLLPVADGDEIRVGDAVFHAIALPGHSPGGMGYLVGEVLFSGDTLFAASIGRTDFHGGDPAAMERSLLRLARLPPETLVLPGHGGPTTIGRECRSNPWLAPLLRAGESAKESESPNCQTSVGQLEL